MNNYFPIFLIVAALAAFASPGKAEPDHHNNLNFSKFKLNADTCIAPADVTVSCENFDPTLFAYGTVSTADPVTVSVDYSLFDTACNRGTITRTFTVTPASGDPETCTQQIVVQYQSDYYIRFPDDLIIKTCPVGSYGAPEIFGQDCEALAVTYTDAMITVVPYACYEIRRTWHIINWCTYNPALPLVYVPNPRPAANTLNPANTPGPIVSPAGTPAPWAPTVEKIVPADPDPTNYSVFYMPDANGYEYTQYIYSYDLQNPEILSCPDSTVTFGITTANDSALWNNPVFQDPAAMQSDLCEGQANLSIRSVDSCAGNDISIDFLLFLDLDGNFTRETVVDSKKSQLPGQVYFGNGLTPNFSGGTPVYFDNRPVPDSLKYIFKLERKEDTSGVTVVLSFTTLKNPGLFTPVKLPAGQHIIKYWIEDMCGNETTCQTVFIIKDTKKPNVTCINGLSVNLDATGITPAISVQDFLLYTNDNCTPDDKLLVAVRKRGAGTGFPVNASGNPSSTLSYNCAEVGVQFVEVWAKDLVGNEEYCETFITVSDNNNVCPTDTSINGDLHVCIQDVSPQKNFVKGLGINIIPNSPGLPIFPPSIDSSSGGCLGIDFFLPVQLPFFVQPNKNTNPLNGVTVIDLIQTARYLLGITDLSNFEKIAGDVTENGSITSFDIETSRKLILGITNEFPSGKSWKFLPAQAQVNALPLLVNFDAIKLGDVTQDADPAKLFTPKPRAMDTLFFCASNRMVQAGDTLEVELTGETNTWGAQFTLETGDMDILGIAAPSNFSPDQYAIFDKKLTVCWDQINAGTPRLILKLKANSVGMLKDFLKITSSPTLATGYRHLEFSPSEVALCFTTVSTDVPQLAQNTPNPFVEGTSVSFYLPKAMYAEFSIFDSAGRLTARRQGDYAQGWHTVNLTAGEMGMLGMYLYQLNTEYGRLVKKMIVKY